MLYTDFTKLYCFSLVFVRQDDWISNLRLLLSLARWQFWRSVWDSHGLWREIGCKWEAKVPFSAVPLRIRTEEIREKNAKHFNGDQINDRTKYFISDGTMFWCSLRTVNLENHQISSHAFNFYSLEILNKS